MIIAVTDRKICRTDLLEQAEAVAASHPDMIILREKDLKEDEYARLAAECLRICNNHGVKFCVNTFTGTAAAIGSERIQLPFGSLADDDDRLRQFREIWVSVHSADEALYAKKKGATHLIFGNVYETSCKPGAAGKGIKELRDVCEHANIPVFAIGGIGTHNAGAVMNAGCHGICLRSLIMRSEDPASVISEMRRRIRVCTK